MKNGEKRLKIRSKHRWDPDLRARERPSAPQNAPKRPFEVNPTTVDVIKRFGGSTSPTMPWPEEEEDGDEAFRPLKIDKIWKARPRFEAVNCSRLL